MENLYDSFARALAPYLTGLLQTYCEIGITGIVEQRYQEYNSELEDRALFGLITLVPGNKDYNEAPLLLEIDTRLAFFMIERLLGGAGVKFDLKRDFTDIEKAILQYLLNKITELLGDAWNEYLEAEATLTGIQTNPHLLQIGAPEDVEIVVELEIRVEQLTARIHLVMPGLNIEELTSKFDYSSFSASQKKKDEAKLLQKRGYIEQHLLDSELEIRAIMHEFSLDAHDVLELQPGDVVPLNKNVGSDMTIYVGDIACFEAKLGHTKLRKAMQITKVL